MVYFDGRLEFIDKDTLISARIYKNEELVSQSDRRNGDFGSITVIDELDAQAGDEIYVEVRIHSSDGGAIRPGPAETSFMVSRPSYNNISWENNIDLGNNDITDVGTLAAETIDAENLGFDDIEVDQVVTDVLDSEATAAGALQSDSLSVEGWNVIDASNYGYPGDRSGGDIMELFREFPNSVFVLPEGEYSVQSELNWTSPNDGYDQLQVIGKPHARLVVDDQNVDHFAWLGNSRGGAFDRLSLQNLTLVVDGRNGYDAGWGRFWVDDTVQNRNLKLEGQRAHRLEEGGKFGYFCCMTDPAGMGIHQNIDMPDGDIPSVQSDNTAIGIGAEPSHVGTNLWLGCYLENWWGNGYYVKDGTGRNVLVGCEARNCGNANIRIGYSDVVIACRSVWDDPRGVDEIRQGVCFDADEANGTAVVGLRIIKETGENATARMRAEARSATYRDVYIENQTDQRSLQVTGTGSNPEQGILALDGVRIIDGGDGSINTAALRIDRENVHLSNVSIDCINEDSYRAALQIQSGSARITNSRLATNGPTYAVILGTKGGWAEIDRATFTDTEVTEGFYLYGNDDQIDSLEIRDCDLREVGDVFPANSPDDDAVNLTRGVWRDNLGYLGETEWGSGGASAQSTDVAPSSTDGSWADVTDYGAVGDGEADDTDAFRRALADSRRVFVPEPEAGYYLTDTLELDGHVLAGESAESVTLGFDLGEASKPVGIEVVDTSTVRDLGVMSGRSRWNLGAPWSGLRANGAHEVTTERLAVRGFEYGLHLLAREEAIENGQYGIANVVDCVEGVRLEATEGGRVDGNAFSGGRIGISSARASEADALDRETYGVNFHNETWSAMTDNTFVAPAIDGVEVGARCTGRYNTFVGARCSDMRGEELGIVFDDDGPSQPRYNNVFGYDDDGEEPARIRYRGEDGIGEDLRGNFAVANGVPLETGRINLHEEGHHGAFVSFDAESREFVFESEGTVVGRLDAENGDLRIAGTVEENADLRSGAGNRTH